jgi:hypothetical protein
MKDIAEEINSIDKLARGLIADVEIDAVVNARSRFSSAYPDECFRAVTGCGFLHPDDGTLRAHITWGKSTGELQIALCNLEGHEVTSFPLRFFLDLLAWGRVEPVERTVQSV